MSFPTAEFSATFGNWQLEYAKHLIATFPVDIAKRPMISNYGKLGLSGSAKLVAVPKFETATGIAFMAGRRNGITILDVDTPDEKILIDALDRHGKTPIIIRSHSGKFHAWYRHNSEPRAIRPEPDKPIDILGGGLVIAPPSQGLKGQYQFIEGGLDDLDRLPVMREVPVRPRSRSELDRTMPAKSGERNSKLFRECLWVTRNCDDFDALLDWAQTRNEEYLPPLEAAEVVKTARSAWGYHLAGKNYVGGCVAVFTAERILRLMPDPHVAALIFWAEAWFKPGAEFWIADGLADQFGWSLHRLREARRRAVNSGRLLLIRPHGHHRPALYALP